MKYSKLVTLGLIGILTFGVAGCTTKTSDKTTTESTTTKENMTLESYKDEFGKIYENNIGRLENYNKYGKIVVEEPTKDYPGNEAYVTELKNAYKDSEEKLQQFVDSLGNVKTEDKKIKDMNDKLIEQGNKVIKELKERSKKLESIPTDLMQKSEVEFKKGLNDLLKVGNNTRTDFDKMIKDAQHFLGIKTK
ncbi:MAG: hypothetical protein ACRCYC_15040 [Paraclostridium sp.]|uniref:hypothetical protein n=1 Tax=Paraclostridium sp. TaxID=2023273 RepID=UPI003F2E3865